MTPQQEARARISAYLGVTPVQETEQSEEETIMYPEIPTKEQLRDPNSTFWQNAALEDLVQLKNQIGKDAYNALRLHLHGAKNQRELSQRACELIESEWRD